MSVEPKFVLERVGEGRHSCADVTRFAEQAGFRTRVDLISGLTATLGTGGCYRVDGGLQSDSATQLPEPGYVV